MKEYNGHRSWNAWNVSLWLNNDYGLYELCMYHVTKERQKCNITSLACSRAARFILKDLPEKTPDGARFNRLSVQLAISGMMED